MSDDDRIPVHADADELVAEVRSYRWEPAPDPGYPITDRCGCGWTSTAPVEFHRRGSDQCHAQRRTENPR